MSHLINMVEREDTFKDRVQRAHMILEMENESTAEVLIWNDPETVEGFFVLVQRLIEQMPDEFKTEYGEHCSPEYYNRFTKGLDDFIVRSYRSMGPLGFVDVTRGLLHNAWMYLEERDKDNS